MINSENILPSRLKDLAVQCKVPVKELVKLFAEVGLILNHKPSTKITPEQINAVLPQVRIYLQSSHPITRKTQKRIDKNKHPILHSSGSSVKIKIRIDYF